MKNKKVLIIAIVAVVIIAVVLAVVLLGGKKDEEPATETYKFGMGSFTTISASDAKPADGKDGAGEATVTSVAVLLNKDGQIVDIVVDCAQTKLSYTAAGKGTMTGDFRTKYEKGTDYAMGGVVSMDKNDDGVVLEWDEQIDAFCATVKGKTLAEVKALVAENGYAQGALVDADCTIKVEETYKALEKAINNAIEFEGTGDETIKLGLSTTGKIDDAKPADSKDGSAEVNTTMFAALLDKDGKVIKAQTDVAQVKFGFTAEGKSTTDTTTAFRTKLEKGSDYGMGGVVSMDKNDDGVVLEWDAQAAAFNKACEGKTLAEVLALCAENGYPVKDLQDADCTIVISEFTKAASKAR